MRIVERQASYNDTRGAMGNSEAAPAKPSSMTSKVRQSIMTSTVPTKVKCRLPQPSAEEIDERFTPILASMDLPADKARILKQYTDEKKWDLICDKEMVKAKESPSFYLNKLRIYNDPSQFRNAKQGNTGRGTSFRHRIKMRRLQGDSGSTQTLRDLEISLRTNSIEWMKEFLNENQGLEVLVDYLSLLQVAMTHQALEDNTNIDTENSSANSSPQHRPSIATIPIGKKKPGRMKASNSRMKFGDTTDDVHICIMCLRAIMNHQNGFILVFEHKQAINNIVLSLNHKNYRTKALVLELLAAICLFEGGHKVILNSFQNFKENCKEKHRFETLMHYFRNYEEFHIDFMVACMQFINIVVHSVIEMNLRIYLQHEFTLLNLDTYLTQKLQTTDSDRLDTQVNAYLDNTIDVTTLLVDSETKAEALEQVQELEEQLSHANEKVTEIEEEAVEKIAELEKGISESLNEVDRLTELVTNKEQKLIELQTTLKVTTEDHLSRTATLEKRLSDIGTEKIKINGIRGHTTTSTANVSPPDETSLPPPPPPISAPAPPAPPAPPGLPGALMSNVQIKSTLIPKCRLPIINWVAMKPNQVRGTVFEHLDDEQLYGLIDFVLFEHEFKLGGSDTTGDTLDGNNTILRPKKVEAFTLLDSNRLRSIAITKRKIEISNENMIKAINGIDLQALSLERVELLQRILPTDQETKLLKEYEKEKRPINKLAEEDRFLLTLLKIERLHQKLQIMSFIGNFFDTQTHLQPQLNAIIAAAGSIRKSQKMRKILEIILAFGNYMNSARRGGVYGFKLQSLQLLLDTKSSQDKQINLLHFIVRTIQDKFKPLVNFHTELNFIDKAATVSLENVVTDITELKKGMELTRREYEARKDRPNVPEVLQVFIGNASDKLSKLIADAKVAQEAYSQVVEYFGENPRTLAPNTFFSLFVKFVNSYKQAVIDLEEQKKKQLDLEKNKDIMSLMKERKKSKLSLVSELKSRQNEKKLMGQKEVYHGALEDLLSEMKNEPYRRSDGNRRSNRCKAGEELHRAGQPIGDF